MIRNRNNWKNKEPSADVSDYARDANGRDHLRKQMTTAVCVKLFELVRPLVGAAIHIHDATLIVYDNAHVSVGKSVLEGFFGT